MIRNKLFDEMNDVVDSILKEMSDGFINLDDLSVVYTENGFIIINSGDVNWLFSDYRIQQVLDRNNNNNISFTRINHTLGVDNFLGEGGLFHKIIFKYTP